MIRLAASLALIAGMAGAEPISGYDFLTPETQALQDDDFANPGMLWVDIGADLWGTGDPSCASCHGAPEAMRDVGNHYPKWSEEMGRVISLEQRINACRVDHQGQEALDDGSRELLGLTAMVMHQSRGLPISVAVDGPAAESHARGEEYYLTPRGQLDLSCADCHVSNAGNRLRGEVVSQGQINGFPIYRQLWQDMGSVSRMIAWCNEAVRAAPLEAGSQAQVDLELYLRSLGNGLRVETPAVRR